MGAKIGGACCYEVISYDAVLFITEVFADGFESGDCTLWSNEVP